MLTENYSIFFMQEITLDLDSGEDTRVRTMGSGRFHSVIITYDSLMYSTGLKKFNGRGNSKN